MMFEELIGKEVLVQMGSASVVTDRHKGTVVEFDETWLKIQRKSKVVIIKIALIGSITINN